MGTDEPPLLPPPLLLTSHGRQSQKQSFYNLLENRYHTTSIPELLNKSVLCSAYGWLLLLDRNNDKGTYSQGQCCLWNPTTLETIELPPLEGDPSIYNRCLLSKPPTDPDCFILLNSISCTEQIFCRIQDDAFFKSDLSEQGYALLSMVSFKGVIYGVIQSLGESKYEFDTIHMDRGKFDDLEESKYEFVTIHMDGGKFKAKSSLLDLKITWEVPLITRNSLITNQDFLMESPCGNELLLVTKFFFSGLHFGVYRLDVGRMECEELYKLDGRTIFINFDGNGFCRYSESFGAAIKSNSIYYTDRNGVVMYVFDFVGGSTMMLLPYPDAKIDNTAENYWVDLPDIAMKNMLFD